jgi:hypothetical protein
MRASDVQEGMAFPEVPEVSVDEAKYALNVVRVYQDPVTQSWTAPMRHLVTQLAKEERVRHAWYDVQSLDDAATLREAVQAARLADVIVVSVYAAEVLPANLYAWIDAWLPRRAARVGALTALIGTAEPPASQPVHTIEYLQAVARKAQLDFIPQAQRLSL